MHCVFDSPLIGFHSDGIGHADVETFEGEFNIIVNFDIRTRANEIKNFAL